MVVARRIGSTILYWITPIYSQPISETTVQHIIRDDMLDPDIAVQIKAFDKEITEQLDDTKFIFDDFNGFGMKDEGSDMP